MKPPSRVPYLVSSLVCVALVLWSLSGIPVPWERLRFDKLGATLGKMFFPPDWGFFAEVAKGLVQSLQIAALGTAIAALLALPFGVLAARNLTRSPVPSGIGKFLLNAIRTFPEILLAIAFIGAVGPGPFAGVLAVAIHSIGMVGKLYAERIETVDKGALEALAAVGASPVEIFRYGIVPEVLPDFLSFALYRFDLNVRSASVLGLVGAGGIGALLELRRSQGASAYPQIGMILLGVIGTVLLVDFCSARLRAKLA
jgi:phosphonate transport system permease protein